MEEAKSGTQGRNRVVSKNWSKDHVRTLLTGLLSVTCSATRPGPPAQLVPHPVGSPTSVSHNALQTCTKTNLMEATPQLDSYFPDMCWFVLGWQELWYFEMKAAILSEQTIANSHLILSCDKLCLLHCLFCLLWIDFTKNLSSGV